MRSLMELGLLGLLLSTNERPTQDNNPVLCRMLNNLGYDTGYLGEQGDEDIKERANQILDHLNNELGYYDASELMVNKVLNRYLIELHQNYHNAFKEDGRRIAITVCALGNKVADKDDSSGVDLWVEQGFDILASIRERFENHDQTENLQHLLGGYAYAEKILSVVDVFVTAHNGMIAGVEEFAPADYQDLYPLEPTDFLVGNECGGNTGCECGCQMDHPIKVLDGLEDYLNGRETEASRYATGVLFANDIKLIAYQGNEEGIMDTIKDMGTKAYEWCRDALKSFMDLFSSDTTEEEIKTAADVAENNKKAIQAMTDKGVRINDAAKAGILALAKSFDPSGTASRIVGGLNTANDASRVIDGLNSLLNKQLGKSGKLGEKLTKAQTALTELKAANSKATSASTDNKDVVANTKTAVSDKIAKAKEALKEVRVAVGEQNKVVKGIQKAIKGISPKIFTKEGGNTADAAEKTAPKAAEAKPAKAPAKGK